MPNFRTEGSASATHATDPKLTLVTIDIRSSLSQADKKTTSKKKELFSQPSMPQPSVGGEPKPTSQPLGMVQVKSSSSVFQIPAQQQAITTSQVSLFP
ncbi:hypothetical protein ACH5RR_033821 [Cinchona calisaya]|uniref:Uncharacterized protein n=1 Tax=Cinchona calisaya TaxID=153742 RepID=A0ABD2YDR2_9GENT